MQKLKKVITFTRADVEGVQYPYHDAMVVTLNIDDYDVHRVLVDNGSSIDVLFYDALVRMNICHEQLERFDALITGFLGELVPIEGPSHC